MKIKVDFTIEVDPAKYEAEYRTGLTGRELSREIREHVLSEARDGCEAWIQRVGIAPEGES